MEKEAYQRRVRSYRDLIVWQKAHELAKRIIEICGEFPTAEEARCFRIHC